jgi:hypothetical protein
MQATASAMAETTALTSVGTNPSIGSSVIFSENRYPLFGITL